MNWRQQLVRREPFSQSTSYTITITATSDYDHKQSDVTTNGNALPAEWSVKSSLCSLPLIYWIMVVFWKRVLCCDCSECPGDAFLCENGECIAPDFVCDGYNGCGDWSDELANCSESFYLSVIISRLPYYVKIWYSNCAFNGLIQFWRQQRLMSTACTSDHNGFGDFSFIWPNYNIPAAHIA